MDVLISFAWFAAFGILVDAIHHLPCGSIWRWHFGSNTLCSRWKAAEAFSFMSAIVWLFSALVVRDLSLFELENYTNCLPGRLVHLPISWRWCRGKVSERVAVLSIVFWRCLILSTVPAVAGVVLVQHLRLPKPRGLDTIQSDMAKSTMNSLRLIAL